MPSKLLKYAALLIVSLGLIAEAQVYYPGSQPSLFPNYSYAPETFTAISQTGAALNVGGVGFGTIAAHGTGFGVVNSATYTSGGTITGTSTQTCTVTFTGGATGTVALTGSNTIAGGTAITIVSGGSAYSAAPTSATLSNGTATCSGTVVVASALTTATWQVQGSIDGGVKWFTLVTAPYPATTLPITTVAVSQTVTGTKLFVINLAGMTNVRFGTTSATFNATTISLKLTASSNKGL